MGMGTSLSLLKSNAMMLEKTWQAWFDGADPEKQKLMEENFEYLLKEVQSFLDYVREEWREGVEAPREKPSYNIGVVSSDFVPSWDRKDYEREGRNTSR